MVNHVVNRILVRRALSMLDLQPGERVLDLFCGLGNFTLPIGRSGAEVLGLEGSAGLVARATQNAVRNGLEENCRFGVANLFDPGAVERAMNAAGPVHKVLIDPPREGAMEVVKRLRGESGPRRIVYVSCDPATLARDASVLVTTQGYSLAAAGVVNMFPHTSHVESIAVFDAMGT